MEQIKLTEHIDLVEIHDGVWNNERFCKDCALYSCTDPGDRYTPPSYECVVDEKNLTQCPGVVRTLDVAYDIIAGRNDELEEMLINAFHSDFPNYSKAYREKVIALADKAAPKLVSALNDPDVLAFFSEDLTEYLKGYFDNEYKAKNN